MRILHNSFLSLSVALLCLCILTPQYVLSGSGVPTSYKEKLQGVENKTKFNNVERPKKSNKLDSKGIFKEKVNSKKTPQNQGFKFPRFDQSLMRIPEKQTQFDRIYKFPSNQQKVLEFRKAKKSLEALYEKNLKYLNNNKNDPSRIPKIVHQIWLGSAVPEKFVSWMSTWANMQGWEYKLWTDLDVETFPLHNRKLYENAKNFGEKADILRYEILYNEGGLYADVDFENINTEVFDLLNRSFDFYAGLEPMEHRQPINSPLIGNAIFASIPGHPLLEKVITDMTVHYNQHENEWAVIATGPVYFTKKFLEHNQSPTDTSYRNIILPPTFLFPLTYSDVRENLKENLKTYLKPETAAVHYWSSSWIEEKKEKPAITKTKPQKKPARRRSEWLINRNR